MTWASDEWPSERARLMSMMPIEREAAVATVEILELEEWLKDDLACQSLHAIPGLEVCAVEVTHYLRSCNTPPEGKLVCREVWNYAVDGWSRETMCACGLPSRDCWTVVPI